MGGGHGCCGNFREDYSAAELRRLAKRSKDANQSRRLLSLAAVREGKDRAEAAKLGGMDRQTLRDWVHRFNAEGPEGLRDHLSEGPKPRLTSAQLAELAQMIETGPDPKTDGVVRWRRIDLKAVIARRFGVAYHERSVRQASQGARLLPHQRPPSPSQAGRAGLR